MTDFTANVKQPTEASGGVVTVYNTCTTTDKFAAQGGAYFLHYKNGGTITGVLFMTAPLGPRAVLPSGAVPAVPAGATNWDDLRISATIAATTEADIRIADISKYVDANGFVNLLHTTPTTLTLAIMGPY